MAETGDFDRSRFGSMGPVRYKINSWPTTDA
jgi:hypothetical protein